jgi:hypothetical protein
MRRRTFLSVTAGAALPAFGAPKGAILDLRWYYMRNGADQQMQRTSQFVEKHAQPALKRAGIPALGVFTGLIAPDGPFLMMVTSHPSLAAMEQRIGKLNEDAEYGKAAMEFAGQPGLAYQRAESSLLRGFDSLPDIEIPRREAGKPPGVFELRVYESNNAVTLARKVKMFDDGEIAIFRKVGMRPVFFGTTMVGRNLPNLTYMVGFDDLAHREQCWRAFGGDPDWKKLRAMPGLSDAEIVSNISSMILRPLPYSAIS